MMFGDGFEQSAILRTGPDGLTRHHAELVGRARVRSRREPMKRSFSCSNAGRSSTNERSPSHRAGKQRRRDDGAKRENSKGKAGGGDPYDVMLTGAAIR
jgi:hypothetical protein